MVGVEFEDALAVGHRVTRFPVHPFECRRKTLRLTDDAGRRIGEPARQPHLTDVVDEDAGQPGEQLVELLVVFVVVFLVGCVGQIDFALGHGLQGFALEIEDLADPHLVDRVGEQQHLDTLLLERLEMRRVLQLLA